MKQKFEKIKDRHKFIKLVSEKTGCSPENISTNWFRKQFLGVPKHWRKWVDEFLDLFLKMEVEKAQDDKKRDEKYFSKL